jgi:hypothetical protein
MRILIHQRPTFGAYVRLLLTRSRRDGRLQHTLAWGRGPVLKNWQHIPDNWQGGSLSARDNRECRGCLRS